MRPRSNVWVTPLSVIVGSSTGRRYLSRRRQIRRRPARNRSRTLGAVAPRADARWATGRVFRVADNCRVG